jgi:putative tricarboxylic transport membrane protein
VLILGAPQLAAFALKFGPIETFALIVLALTCIASVSRGSMAKGLLAGVFGLFIAVVGSDPLSGDIRFTFDIFVISAGFDVIPVVVGLFAMSEVFVRVAYRAQASSRIIRYDGMKLPGFGAITKRIGVLLKSSAIGSAVGVLPGTGAATAAFIAYAEAKRSSRNGDKFGTGEPDGIIAPESANNAVTGSALVPTLALGIPGDAVTAVMLATLVINGITPGVRLMADNPAIVYASFIALLLANVAMLVVAVGAARVFSWMLRMSEPYLMMGITLFSLLGSYGVRGNVFDLYVMLGAGAVGFLLRLVRVPLAPIVIGLVLGPQLEINLRQGLVLTDGAFGAFFLSPIAACLFVATAIFLCLPLIRRWLDGRSRKIEAPEG